MKIDQAVKGIIIHDNKVLVLKQQVNGNIFYSLPGGRIKSENFKNELVREVKEETGLDVSVDKFINNWSFTRGNGDITECKVYFCSPTSPINLHKDNSEDEEDIQEFLWLTKEEINAPELPLDKDLKKIILQF
jgi:8-oxo-dGTP pyrophosphatase MutT (NUDIX family)